MGLGGVCGHISARSRRFTNTLLVKKEELNIRHIHYRNSTLCQIPCQFELLDIQARQRPRNLKDTFQSLASSESTFFVFLCSFFSFFFRFRSALSSAVSSSCLFRFFDVPSPFGGDAWDGLGASTVDPACA